MQNDSVSLLKPINVRLCGSIPRKDLIIDDEQAGAPWCRARSSPFAMVANGPTPTLGERELIVVDQQQPPATMTSCVDFKPLCPVLEPPAWAVPAQGETRLEVSCFKRSGCLGLLILRESRLTVRSITSFSSISSLCATLPEGKHRWTLPSTPVYVLGALLAQMFS
jgi:hypothetical protein